MSFQISMMITTLTLAMTMNELWMTYVYAVTFGIVFAFGALFDNNVWAELFGREHLGAIRGYTATFLIFGTSSGPWLFGWMYDMFGSYDVVLSIGVVVGIIPMVLG